MKSTTPVLKDLSISAYHSKRDKVNRFFRLHPFFIRLRSWEFWPLDLVYIPVYANFLLLALRARSLFFFTSTNPGIETGGLYGDSKIDILNKIPTHLIPRTCFIPSETELETILQMLGEADISFPLVAKPDIGERGFLVEKLYNAQELQAYLSLNEGADILIQEFVGYSKEVSVLYYRFPNEQKGYITSITLKKFLSVTGDGRSTLRELIDNYPRAKLQKETLEKRYASILDTVMSLGEEKELVPIGNHSRGTTFLDGTHFVDRQLCETFDKISHQLDGIYFGRFDIKCQSLQDLKAGKNFKILEINGVKAEPTHIYDPSFPLMKAYKVLFKQWRTIYQISMINKSRGVPFMGTKEGLKKYFAWARYKKSFEN